jgi:hypothetical protein
MGLFLRTCKDYFQKTLGTGAWTCARDAGMRMVPDRAVLTVTRRDGVWCVEYDGEAFGHSSDKEVARAAAHRHARAMLDRGRASEVRVFGETGFRSA